ncbi:hypothetical protein SAMN02910317_01321 [Ruminococcaceae bacterium FB2012]|nr:hypothetical protein SAMN02910317_01321 [Ruminococcaceae bacterium FB2012]
MKYSVSIVTYNSIDDIGEVLNCLQKSDIFQDIETFVIDNCSTDGTVDYVVKNYPFVKVIKNKRNGGYGYGHNAAIGKIHSKVHFIINPDIRFDTELIRKTGNFLLNSKSTVICTPEMVSENGDFVFPPKAQPKLHLIFARFFRKIRFFEKWRKEYSMHEKVMNNDGKPFNIDFCSGAFMAIKTKYYKKVKGFDDRYFLYYEDADLTRKLLKYGACKCVPSLSVIHEGKRAAYHSLKCSMIMISSMVKYFSKWGFKI